MKALDRKLLRDVAAMKGQVATIAVVVACGIATWIAARGTYASLGLARDLYYEEHRLADVFVHLKRAPDSVVQRLATIPGVARAYGRLVEGALVPIRGAGEPASATLVSLPREGQPPLDALHLRSGRLPEGGRADEVVVLEAFAKAHGLAPGDQLPVVMNGAWRELRIVGVALSPEFVFAMQPGSLTMNAKSFAVLWMDRGALAAAFRLDGVFDDALLKLQPGASSAAVLAEVDRVLAPYGASSAQPRDRAASPRMVDAELDQLRGMALVAPAIFISVAAFLLNVVLGRLVHLQRTQIAVLKAFGYRGWTIAAHFLGFAAVVVGLGAVLGVALGSWVGGAWTDLYAEYFHFPRLAFATDVGNAAAAIGVTLAAGAAGAWLAVKSALRLSPAEAMQPAAPASYRRSLLDRLALGRLLGPALQMSVRELARRPARAASSVVALAMAFAVLVVGRFSYDSVEDLLDVEYGVGKREDVAVALRAPVPLRDVAALRTFPGVLRAEGIRTVPARVGAGSIRRDVPVISYPAEAQLRRPIELPARVVPLVEGGALVTRTLGEILGVRAGDVLDVEVLEGARRRVRVQVARLTDEPAGLALQMRLEDFSALLGEEPSASTVLLAVDRALARELVQKLREVPAVASVSRHETAIAELARQMDQSMLAFAAILTGFAGAIAVGVVYNNARVTLSVRARDLASLRVLGFTRGEVFSMLLGETALQLVAAVPVGMVLAWALASWIMTTVDAEMYRYPVTIHARTYAFAATVVLAATAVSALLVYRRIGRLDLAGVLKARD